MYSTLTRQEPSAERGSEENYSDIIQVLSLGTTEIQFGPNMLHITCSGQVQPVALVCILAALTPTTAVEGQHSHNIQDQFGSHDTAEALCRTQFGQSGLYSTLTRQAPIAERGLEENHSDNFQVLSSGQVRQVPAI